MERKNFPKIWTLVFLLIFAKRTSESDDLTPFRNKINIGEYIACLQIMSLLYGISYTFGQNTQFEWLNHMTISFANKKTPSLPTCKTKLKNNSTTSPTRLQNFGCFLNENSAKITTFNHAIFLLNFISVRTSFGHISFIPSYNVENVLDLLNRNDCWKLTMNEPWKRYW